MDAIVKTQGKVKTCDTREACGDKLLPVFGCLERPVGEKVPINFGCDLLFQRMTLRNETRGWWHKL